MFDVGGQAFQRKDFNCELKIIVEFVARHSFSVEICGKYELTSLVNKESLALRVFILLVFLISGQIGQTTPLAISPGLRLKYPEKTCLQEDPKFPVFFYIFVNAMKRLWLMSFLFSLTLSAQEYKR